MKEKAAQVSKEKERQVVKKDEVQENMVAQVA